MGSAEGLEPVNDLCNAIRMRSTAPDEHSVRGNLGSRRKGEARWRPLTNGVQRGMTGKSTMFIQTNQEHQNI